MFTVEQIEAEHAEVKTGADFPKYTRAIKQLGVTALETWVSDSHTEYFGKDGFQIKSGAMYSELAIADRSDKEKFIQYLKSHQQGETDYITFCKDCAETGIEKWFISLHALTCTYFDKAGNEILVEEIPG